ncbi:DUF6364 family protein [Acidobacteriota bacterium]
MGDKQNITLRLDQEIIREAKVLAAQRGTSVSRLLAEYVKEIIGREKAFQASRRRALRLLKKGLHLAGKEPPPRDELHER